MMLPLNTILSPLRARLLPQRPNAPSELSYDETARIALEALASSWLTCSQLAERLQAEYAFSLATLRSAEKMCGMLLDQDIEVGDARAIEELRSSFRDLIAVREEVR